MDYTGKFGLIQPDLTSWIYTLWTSVNTTTKPMELIDLPTNQKSSLLYTSSNWITA